MSSEGDKPDASLRDSALSTASDTSSAQEDNDWFFSTAASGFDSIFRVARSTVNILLEIAEKEDLEELPIPWGENLELKEKMMQISSRESTFTQPHQDTTPLTPSRVHLIERLLALDENLAHAHAIWSPHMDENIFWNNYFANCEALAADYWDEESTLPTETGQTDQDSLVAVDDNEEEDPQLNEAASSASSFVNIPTPPSSLGSTTVWI